MASLGVILVTATPSFYPTTDTSDIGLPALPAVPSPDIIDYFKSPCWSSSPHIVFVHNNSVQRTLAGGVEAINEYGGSALHQNSGFRGNFGSNGISEPKSG
jgi:hypothetical protein